jgi:5-methylcytosine-specific restriction endonuclease McrA
MRGKHHALEQRLCLGPKLTKSVASILDLSSRTVRKILQRLNVGCSRCGWHEGGCDIHHVHGRKIVNANVHSNLALLCPNCHRLVHEHKILPESLVTLDHQVGDSWKDQYGGRIV